MIRMMVLVMLFGGHVDVALSATDPHAEQEELQREHHIQQLQEELQRPLRALPSPLPSRTYANRRGSVVNSSVERTFSRLDRPAVLDLLSPALQELIT